MPNSIVRLLTGVPLKPSYDDTITFVTVEKQAEYFIGKTAYSFTDLSYIRDGYVLIPDQVGLYESCNYLMYKNQDYINKWFYAFITDVEYLANGTTRVYFTLDLIQTWLFEMNIQSCFVEREHVNDDTIGANTLPEPVALGEYVTNSQYKNTFSDFRIVLAVLPDGEFIDREPQLKCNIYQGLAYYVFEQASEVTNFLNSLSTNGLIDNVIQIYMVPYQFTSGNNLISNVTEGYITACTRPTTVNGYVPKNNKLLTYPYIAAMLDNGCGQQCDLCYEYIGGENSEINYIASPYPGGRIIAYPGVYNGIEKDYNYSVTLGNYPECTWTKDSYSNWLAVQNIRWGYQKDRAIVNSIAGGVGSVLSGASSQAASGAANGGLYGAAGGAIGGALGTAARAVIDAGLNFYNMASELSEEKEVHSVNPVSAGNTTGCDSTLAGANSFAIWLKHRSIKKEYAVVIDDFFSAFGYKVNRVKTPNITGRASWNYVKCNGAIVNGQAPVPALATFENALNKGIRFWHGDYVGDYSRSNAIV